MCFVRASKRGCSSVGSVIALVAVAFASCSRARNAAVVVAANLCVLLPGTCGCYCSIFIGICKVYDKRKAAGPNWGLVA